MMMVEIVLNGRNIRVGTDSAMMKPKEEVSIDLEDGRSWRERNPKHIVLRESLVDSLSCLMLEKQ